MKILMISTDRALLGEKVTTGDAVKRHVDYGRRVEKIDIIVFSGKSYQTKKLADNVFCYPTNSKNRWAYIKDSVRIAQNIFEGGVYDLVVCQDPFLAGLAGVKIKKKFRTKLLVHFHGDFWKNKYWLRENWFRLGLILISKRIVKQADFIRVVSKGIKNKLVAAGVDRKKIKVISTPVDLSQFEKIDNETVDSIRNEFKGKKIILWAGKMRPEKNLEFLIGSFKEIISKYRNAVLVLAGSGKDFDKINKLRLESGLKDKVKMTGHVDYDMLNNYFYACDIVVLPSRHESFGKVLVEAGAAGKPAVASKTTGAKEIVKDGKTGFLVEINSKSQLVDRIVKLLEDHDQAVSMGQKAYKLVLDKFDYDKGVEKIVGYWREIAGQ